MRKPPDKRKTPPVEGGAFQLDSISSRLGQTEHNPDSQSHQGLNSYAQLPFPVAVARQFGFCHAVFVWHPSGQEERRGLYRSARTASLAARELNRLFEQETEAEEDERRSNLAKVHSHWREISKMLGDAA